MDILSFSIEELTKQIDALGEQPFRAKQVYKWLHKKHAQSFSEMTDLSKTLRDKLQSKFYIQGIVVEKKQVSNDGTEKYLFKLQDGNFIETVVMKYKSGVSVCISTQVGCRMGCSFCASTQSGLIQNLSVGEMLQQVYTVEREIGQPVDSIVLMGIGEPLDNFDNTISFLKIITSEDGRNLGQRNISLSTCGVVPGIEKLANCNFGLTLSISLHAPFDEMRNEMMPINKVYPIEKLLAVCKYYQKMTGRRISFEYTVIPGLNDTHTCAVELKKILRGIISHVNLIPLNYVEGTRFSSSSEQDAYVFAKELEDIGVVVTVRRKLGQDISAACGQLRTEAIKSEQGV